MGTKTGISWTDATWNPIRGCSRVSEGCRHCYAESVAHRFSGPGLAYEGLVQLDVDGKSTGKWNGQIKFVEEHLLDPLRWKKPRRIFVNSMSDLFHENVTDQMRDKVFAVMALSPQHTFQVLTKRPGRMLEYLERACGRIADLVMKMRADRGDRGGVGPLPHIAPGAIWWPLANVWLGVSVENQKTADERIPLLLQTPAAIRFISAEPLLGPIQLDDLVRHDTASEWHFSCLDCDVDIADDPDFNGARLDWVIVGGESGPAARPMHPDWARSLREQCKAARVPFFFKQWGEWIPWQPDGGFSEWKSQAGKLMDRHAFPDMKDPGVRSWTDDYLYDGDDICVHQRVGTKASGCLLDGVEHHEFPA